MLEVFAIFNNFFFTFALDSNASSKSASRDSRVKEEDEEITAAPEDLHIGTRTRNPSHWGSDRPKRLADGIMRLKRLLEQQQPLLHQQPVHLRPQSYQLTRISHHIRRQTGESSSLEHFFPSSCPAPAAATRNEIISRARSSCAFNCSLSFFPPPSVTSRAKHFYFAHFHDRLR